MQVAYAWGVSLGGELGSETLSKFGLLDQALEYAMESGAFAHAFELCRGPGAEQKLPGIHLKYAMYLEDEGTACWPCSHSTAGRTQYTSMCLLF